MNQRTYFVISGVIFGGVALLHLLRLINHWEVILGPWTMPLWLSWLGLFLAGGLSVWALLAAGRWKRS